MSNVSYLTFDLIDPNSFLVFLNNKKIRKHLIKHDLFTMETLTPWINSKLEVDRLKGCKVRGIFLNKKLVGWCGIQLENEAYEIAIIISDKHWGLGKTVFQEMMEWAKQLGHNEVYIHFLHTRPNYKFLNKIAQKISQTELFGNQFTTYKIPVK